MMKGLSLLLQSSLVSKDYTRPSTYTCILRCILCSLLIGLASRLVFFLPFCAVPVVLQVQLCLFFASLYGAKEGIIIVLLFLLQGIMGAPVFAGGLSGIGHLMGPSGGYLIGYILGAFCTGKIVESSTHRTMLPMMVGNAMVYIVGALHLSNFIPMKQIWWCGVVPYIPLDLLKVAFFARLKSCRDRKEGTSDYAPRGN